jgi:negative regulator of genetic competence, sporulation and motility
MDQANAEVAATIARMREYQENSQQFCKRIQDYLDIAFKHQVSHASFYSCGDLR